MAGGHVEHHVECFPPFCLHRELEVARLAALKACTEQFVDCLLHVERNKVREKMINSLLPRDLGELCTHVVPLHNLSIRIRQKDGRVSCSNERLQLQRHSIPLSADTLRLGNVLPHTHHAHHPLPVLVPARRRAEQQMQHLKFVDEQRELIARRLVTRKPPLQHPAHPALILRQHKLIHKVLPKHLLLTEARQLGQVGIPLIYLELLVHPEDGRVGPLDKVLVGQDLFQEGTCA
mmetsp:Transcript_66226/g.163102  ORF Transcript_66226/g.163102 Transcript_66226/m.163102 type:complete len:234 (+) Transcript_66226:811-1512(+)